MNVTEIGTVACKSRALILGWHLAAPLVGERAFSFPDSVGWSRELQ